jgi:hypothetical protein
MELLGTNQKRDNDMPRPAKPVERKRRLGNPGTRKLPEPTAFIPQVTDVPEPLRPFATDIGSDTWVRIWESGSQWISGITDVQIVQMLCECEEERQQLRALATKSGADWRDRVALRSIDNFILSLLSLLGFTPVDRAKLGLGEVRPASIIDELKARRNSG